MIAPARYEWHVGDVRRVLATLPAGSIDLVLSSPPFLALRSYLPPDHPAKADEIGSEATPVVEACARVLAPHGSLCLELGDTYAGSGSGISKPTTVPTLRPLSAAGKYRDRDADEAAHAVRNALDKMVRDGAAELVEENPRRYAATK